MIPVQKNLAIRAQVNNGSVMNRLLKIQRLMR